MRAALAVVLLASGSFTALAGQRDVPPDTSIRLERTRCFGTCPAYSVIIDAQGNVVFEGLDFVRVKGRQSDRIPVTKVRSLLDTAERIGFFDLQKQYRTVRNSDGTLTYVSDLPTTIVTVRSAGRSKRVEDYIGTPKALRAFEGEIDTAAHTRRWIRIDEVTLQDMARSGAIPSVEDRTTWLRDALINDDVGVVKELIALGTDPNTRIDNANRTPLMFVRSAAMARLLLDAGADPAARSADGDSVLHDSVGLDPDVAALLVEAGAPVDVPDDDGRTPMWRAACDGNAGVVSILLAAGADPAGQPASRRESALECARKGQQSARHRSDPLVFESAFVPDYDRTIALLHDALARQNKR